MDIQATLTRCLATEDFRWVWVREHRSTRGCACGDSFSLYRTTASNFTVKPRRTWTPIVGTSTDAKSKEAHPSSEEKPRLPHERRGPTTQLYRQASVPAATAALSDQRHPLRLGISCCFQAVEICPRRHGPALRIPTGPGSGMCAGGNAQANQRQNRFSALCAGERQAGGVQVLR